MYSAVYNSNIIFCTGTQTFNFHLTSPTSGFTWVNYTQLREMLVVTFSITIEHDIITWGENPHTHSLTNTLTQTLSQTHKHSLTNTQTLSHTHTHTHTHKHTHKHSLTNTHTHTNTLSHIHKHTNTLTHTNTLSQTHKDSPAMSSGSVTMWPSCDHYIITMSSHYVPKWGKPLKLESCHYTVVILTTKLYIPVREQGSKVSEVRNLIFSTVQTNTWQS